MGSIGFSGAAVFFAGASGGASPGSFGVSASVKVSAFGMPSLLITSLTFLIPFHISRTVNSSTDLSPADFLKEILYQLGVEDDSQSKADFLHALNEEMLKNMKNSKDTIIIIDEAQVIKDKEIFEELRLLLNFQLNERFLFTLILIGQPELKKQIEDIPQLEQRIAIKYHLRYLDIEQTAKYIFHRLKTAGMDKGIFTKEAIEKIYEETKGVPRRINNLCDLSLLVGYSLKLNVIDSKTIIKAIEDGR